MCVRERERESESVRVLERERERERERELCVCVCVCVCVQKARENIWNVQRDSTDGYFGENCLLDKEDERRLRENAMGNLITIRVYISDGARYRALVDTEPENI